MLVAKRGINSYINILELEAANYPDIVVTTLDLLNTVLTDDEEANENDHIGEQLSDLLLRKQNFMPQLIKLLECYDFGTRRFFLVCHYFKSEINIRAAVALVTSLLRHRSTDVQVLFGAKSKIFDKYSNNC